MPSATETSIRMKNRRRWVTFLLISFCSAFMQQECHSSIDRIGCSTAKCIGAQSAGRNLDALVEWGQHHATNIHDGVQLVLHNLESSEYQVMSLRSLAKGTTVLSVPLDLIFDSSNTTTVPDESPLSADFASQVPEFHLFVQVLIEYSKGESSFWYPWLYSLPQRFDTGVCWDDEERALLPGFARALADYELLKLQAFRDALQHVHGLTQATIRDDELTLWAFNVVYTRCWKVPTIDPTDDVGRSHIVPLGDMFNHDEPANVEVVYHQNNAVVSFVLVDDVAAGTPLTLSYGLPHNPHRFLVIFGFCHDRMPEVFSQVVFDEPVSAELIELGARDRTRMVYRCNDGAIGNAVWDVVVYTLLAQVPETQAAFLHAHRQSKSENDAESDIGSKSKQGIHDKYKLEAAMTLRSHIASTLAELETLNGAADQLKKQRAADENHPRLDMISRHNLFLKEVWSSVQARLDGMIDSEKTRRLAALRQQQIQK